MRSVWLTFFAVKVQLIGVHTAKDVLDELNKTVSSIEMVSSHKREAMFDKSRLRL